MRLSQFRTLALFCGIAAGDFTIEDVIPEWAVQAFAIQHAELAQALSELEAADRPPDRSSGVSVCRPGYR
jgi:hypothetical protein